MQVYRGARRYFYWFGLTAHILLIALLWALFSNQITSHWRWKQLAGFFSGPVDSTPVTVINAVPGGKTNPAFHTLAKGRWIKIHQQGAEDTVKFDRQRHGGSAFDSKRGRLILFGSDTHGTDWSNVIRTFDMGALRWSVFGEIGRPEHYTVSSDGVPIASADHVQPWAMHTFDAIEYDPIHDRLIVASHPEHLKPGRFGNWLADIWPQIQQHPTWVYDFVSNQWEYDLGKTTSFFPYATAYDSRRGHFLGIRPDGIFQYLQQGGWSKVVKKGPYAYHTNAVYDQKNDAVVIFGNNKNSNDVWIYRPETEQLKRQSTAGIRPPGTQASPLAYHAGVGQVVALVDDPDQDAQVAQTWMYDTALDRWERLPEGDFPYRLGMNYNLQYDNLNNLLVLAANAPKEAISVWVLRL
ncbi:hypothetical protein [Sedimenticola selenatireducens]|uniref:hypothetical protein n=1 Tax=Sedimenticola selenatireducens TaxID=191960 RepID=UPI002AAC2A35|nr:hypothetical protein [Sedimenticola selenatireducens]